MPIYGPHSLMYGCMQTYNGIDHWWPSWPTKLLAFSFQLLAEFHSNVDRVSPNSFLRICYAWNPLAKWTQKLFRQPLIAYWIKVVTSKHKIPKYSSTFSTPALVKAISSQKRNNFRHRTYVGDAPSYTCFFSFFLLFPESNRVMLMLFRPETGFYLPRNPSEKWLMFRHDGEHEHEIGSHFIRFDGFIFSKKKTRLLCIAAEVRLHIKYLHIERKNVRLTLVFEEANIRANDEKFPCFACIISSRIRMGQMSEKCDAIQVAHMKKYLKF